MTPLEQLAIAYGKAAIEYDAMEKHAMPTHTVYEAGKRVMDASKALREEAKRLACVSDNCVTKTLD